MTGREGKNSGDVIQDNPPSLEFITPNTFTVTENKRINNELREEGRDNTRYNSTYMFHTVINY